VERKRDEKNTGGSRLEQVPQKPRRPKRRSRLEIHQKILIAVAVLLALVLALVLGWQSLFVRPELPSATTETKTESGQTATVTKPKPEIDYGEGIRPKADGERKSEDYYTVLILGRDTGGGGNTDTMLLASYDVTNQRVTVMSIPRDTMVNVPWDVKKINSVYSRYGSGDSGVQAVYKEIAQLVGFEPDYQVVVEWDAIGEIVDAMDGVYFDVPYQMEYDDPYQDLVIRQDKGYRLLSGDDAMQVIRWRHNNDGTGYPDSDLGRIRTQQNFLKAVIKQLLQVKNVTKIGEFATVFRNNVETNLSFQEMLWFGQKAVMGGLKLENVNFLTMPNKLASAYSPSVSKVYGRDMNQSYVVPLANDLLDLVNNALSPFVEESKLSDLDIMSVNRDGSVSSSTGYVEDKVAALPPVKIGTPKAEEEEIAEEGTGDGGSIVIDPETGEIISGETEQPPEEEEPEEEEPQEEETETSAPQTPPAETTKPKPQPQPQAPVVPQTPAEPEVPMEPEFSVIDPNFAIIEPPPEG